MNGHPVSVPLAPTTTTTILPDPLYCQNFKFVGSVYKRMHGYTSVTVCTFGVLANTLNLIVLTRKEMINSTNAILTGLALADLFNMVEYVPFAIYMNFLPDQDGNQRKTYPWAVYVLVHSNFSQVCHTISIWLTLTLAVWRYIMISMPLRCKTLCSMERAKWSIATAYLVSPLLCLPIYFTFSISAIAPPAAGAGVNSVNSSSSSNNSTTDNASDLMELGIGNVSQIYLPEEDYMSSINMTTTTPAYPLLENDNNNLSSTSSSSSSSELFTPPEKYVVNLSALAKKYPLLMTANFWFYSVVLKLLPCVMLTIVSLRLINSLLEAKKRKEKLFGVRIVGGLPIVAGVQIPSSALASPSPQPTTETDADSNGGGGSRSGSFTRSTGEVCVTTRTTRMLLAVLLLFLLTEFPQGILALLSDLLGDKFFKECYYPVSDLLDFVALLNSSINFLLYCSTSSRFRDTAVQVFHLSPVLNFCRRRQQRERPARVSSIASQIGNNCSGKIRERDIVLATISGQQQRLSSSLECRRPNNGNNDLGQI